MHYHFAFSFFFLQANAKRKLLYQSVNCPTNTDSMMLQYVLDYREIVLTA